ncbi:MAG TPA: methyltransferase domain-containing protein [Gammaproteobacteria bacterium]|nr:methyltransferase domain-containing protein [Gammaproteobacteria bacterium]
MPPAHGLDGAVCFEHHVTSPFTSPDCRELLRAARVMPGDRVLDLASGTGVVARAAARRVGRRGRVVALDPSGPLLGYGRQIAASDAATAEIVFQKGDPGSLPFEDEAFDVVLYQQALRRPLTDPATLDELRRVLRPGGRIAFALLREIGHSPFHHVLARAIQRYGAASVAAGICAPFPMDDAESVRRTLEHLEFRELRVRNRILKVRYSPALEASVRGCLRALHLGHWYERLPPAERAAFLREVARGLAPCRDALGFAIPAGYRMLRAAKPVLCPRNLPSLWVRTAHRPARPGPAQADKLVSKSK